MPWPFLAFINIITSAVVVLLQRILMKEEESNPVGSAIIFQFGLAIMGFLFAVTLGHFAWPSFVSHPEFLIWFTLSTFLWAGSTLFSFKAAKRIGAAEITILGASNSIISILLSVLFLSEVLKVSTIAGTILILFAIWFINSEKLSFGSRRGVVYALLSASCAGVAVVVDALTLKTYDAFSYVAIMSLLPGIVLLGFFPRQITKIPALLKPKPFLFMCFFCFIYTIQAISYYLAFQNGAPMSRLTPLSKSSIILTVILAVIFLRERSNLPKKIVAAALVTIGAILLG
jgi:uncharacterized membrane protein